MEKGCETEGFSKKNLDAGLRRRGHMEGITRMCTESRGPGSRRRESEGDVEGGREREKEMRGRAVLAAECTKLQFARVGMLAGGCYMNKPAA